MTADIRYYPEVDQRSEEWERLRCGLVTASVVGRLLSIRPWGGLDYACDECGAPGGEPCRSLAKRGDAEPKEIKTLHGARTDVAVERRASSPLIVSPATSGDDLRRLTLTIAAERITRYVDPAYMTFDMWRGVEEEPLARTAYSEHHASVTEVGFVTRRLGDTVIGYSPDGLVGDDGLIEIKSRRNRTQLETILDDGLSIDGIPVETMAQLQCGLLVTDRKWIDYVSYSGGMPLWVKRIRRRDNWADAITAAVVAVEQAVTGMIERYNAAVAGLPIMERTPEILEMVV